MHELSIAQSLVDLATRAIAHLDVRRVVEVRVSIGALSGVAPDALLFAYDVATEGTILGGSSLVIRPVPAVVHCPHCARDVELDDIQWFCCSVCGTPTGDLRHGRELDIEAVEVETTEDDDPHR